MVFNIDSDDDMPDQFLSLLQTEGEISHSGE